jgi:phage gp29-like protein
VVFAEVFGPPLRVGRFGPGASEEDKRTLLRALRNVAQDCAAMIPAGMEMEFIESRSGNAGHELFEKMADWFDKQTSKAVLGQVGTTDAIAGGHAVGKVHREVEQDIERADAKGLENTINRDLVRPLIDLNMGPQKQYPLLKIIIEDPQDAIQLANAVGAMVDRGLKVKQIEIRQKLGLSDPGPDDELLTPPAQGDGRENPAAGGGGATAGRLSVHAAGADNSTDAIDALIGQQLAGWQPKVKPLLQPVMDLLGQCSSYEEFLAKLPGVLKDMDPSLLTDALAKSLFGARMTGEGGGDISGS